MADGPGGKAKPGGFLGSLKDALAAASRDDTAMHGRAQAAGVPAPVPSTPAAVPPVAHVPRASADPPDTPPPVPAQAGPAAQPGLLASQARPASARTDLLAPASPTISGEVSQPPARAVALLGEVDGVQVRVLLDAKVEGVDCVAVSAVESAKRWNVAVSSIACLRLEVVEISAG